MAFGKEPQAHPQTTNFFVACVAYLGEDRASDVILAGEGKGRLEEQIRRSDGFEVWDGPRTTTALIGWRHRWFPRRHYAITGSKVMLEVFRDRIDVTSPGTLPNHMSVENVRSGGNPRSRNELMANAILVARLMEQRGRGWPVMRKAMREFNGGPEIVQDQGGKFVRVTFRREVMDEK